MWAFNGETQKRIAAHDHPADITGGRRRYVPRDTFAYVASCGKLVGMFVCVRVHHHDESPDLATIG